MKQTKEANSVGAVINVIVGTVPVKTMIDPEGVQRFVPDKLVQHLHEHGKIDLNRLWLACENGLFDKEELIKLYIGLGYSVSGFADVFPELTIWNPLHGEPRPQTHDGYTLAFTIGRWGGVWWHPGYAKVITLGWVSIMLIPRDLQYLLGDLTRKKFLQ